MLSERLVEYLKKEKRLGVDFQTVEMALRNNGWEEEQINESRLWYAQHKIDDITVDDQQTTDNSEEELLPDLRGARETDKILEKSEKEIAVQHPIPTSEDTKKIKRFSKKHSISKSETKSFVLNHNNQSNKVNITKVLLKSTFYLILFGILTGVSLSTLITYDIIHYDGNPLATKAKALVLGLPFTPKTADYILQNLTPTLQNKPQNINITVNNIGEKYKPPVDMDITGKIYVSDSKENTKADLVVKKKDTIIAHILYTNNHIYTQSARYNSIIPDFFSTYFKITINPINSRWLDEGYMFPYDELFHSIYTVTKGSAYLNRDAHTIRMRLNKDQLNTVSQNLETQNFNQLTDDLDSMIVTLFLSDDNSHIEKAEIEATRSDKVKYFVSVKFKDTDDFVVSEPEDPGYY